MHQAWCVMFHFTFTKANEQDIIVVIWHRSKLDSERLHRQHNLRTHHWKCPGELPADPGLSPTLTLDNIDSHLQQHQTVRAIAMFLKGSWGAVSDRQKSRTQRNEQGEYCKRNCTLLDCLISSHYIAQASLELVIPLTEFPWCWNFIELYYTWLKLYFYNKISDHLKK